MHLRFVQKYIFQKGAWLVEQLEVSSTIEALQRRRQCTKMCFFALSRGHSFRDIFPNGQTKRIQSLVSPLEASKHHDSQSSGLLLSKKAIIFWGSQKEQQPFTPLGLHCPLAFSLGL